VSTKPHIIEFSKTGEPGIGYLSIAETGKSIPFEIRRAFWAYYTPDSILRGRHAHHKTEMVLVAVAGRIVVTTETAEHGVNVFTLEEPNKGLYLPAYCWHTMQYSHNAVQLVLASTDYDEKDYIRDYELFKKNV